MRQLSVLFMFALVVVGTARGMTATGNSSAETASTKEGYAEIVGNKIDVWEKMIDRVEDGKYNDQTFQRAVSAKEAKELAAELRLVKEQVEKDLANLKDAKGDSWKKWQSSIQAKLGKLRNEFRDVRVE